VSGLQRRLADIADILLWRTLEQPPTLARGRLLCVDGRAGSGKTILGAALAQLAAEHGSVRLLHMDDIYEGWEGLDATLPRVAGDLVAPLREGRAGSYQRYDWYAERLAERIEVAPVDLLILEGVGAGASAYDDAITTLVWVDAPRPLRLARGIERDGQQVLPRWLVWMDDEDYMFARERTRQRADVVVDGTGDSDRAIVFV
jgi:uridine kinase